jgi:hypothetical protein
MEWQSIETAPKDGTKILAWNGATLTTVYWYTFSGEWLSEEQRRMGGYWELECPGGHAEDIDWEPTHWMDLPAPPISK